MAHRRKRERSVRRQVLSIDPRIQRIGFACFEGSNLADWGVKNVRAEAPSVRTRQLIIPMLVKMLDQFQPTALLVPDAVSGSVRRSPSVVGIIQAVVREASDRGIPVYFISDLHVKHSFSRSDGRMARKADVHQAIVKVCPELLSLIPRNRRTWHPERYSTPLFHAVAMYCAWRART